MNFAPVVLFVYNRLWHTRLTVEALQQNDIASVSDLYIFSDAAKQQTDEQAVQAVRNYIQRINGFRTLTIIERETNLGLANSIISGVTEVIQKYGRVIVLEDDIVPSPGFLRYMNDALNMYSDEPQVGCIHAWNYGLDIKNYNELTFFLKGADCWGWATWQRAWSEFNPNGIELLETIKAKKLVFDFNRRNTHEFMQMLMNQIDGKNDSWAIRWHASLVVNGMYCLHPTIPIVRNIGLDNSGVHCGEMNIDQTTIDYLRIQRIPIRESDWFFTAYSEYLKKSVHPTTTKWQKLKSYLNQLFLR